MSVSQSTSVATILREHVTLEVESIDRMYPGQLHLNSLSRYCETCLSGMMRPMRPRIPRLARIDTRPRFYVGRKGDA